MKINNIEDLKSEINRLSLAKAEQEVYLTQQYDLLRNKLSAPMRVANSIFSSIPGVGLVKNLLTKKEGSKGKSDWLTRSLQFGMPLVLNRTLLKNAGWIKKALVLFASETAARQVNQNKVGSVINKLTNFIRPKKNKAKKKIEQTVDHIHGQVDEQIVAVKQEVEDRRDDLKNDLNDLKTKLD